MTAERLTALIQGSLEDAKARDVVVMDVRGRTTITDFIVIATGTSSRHVRAIAERVIELAKLEQREVLGVEGMDVGEWVLIDLGDAVVHVMLHEARVFYDLEQLWKTEIPVHKALETG